MALFGLIKNKTKQPVPIEVLKNAPTQRLSNETRKIFIQAFNDLNGRFSARKFNSDSLLKLYEEVTQVNSVINYITIKGGDVVFKHVKYLTEGEIKDLGETDLIKLLQENPTLIQEIIAQLVIQGNCFVRKRLTPGFKYATSLQVLDSSKCYPIPQYSLDNYGTPATDKTESENPIIKYYYYLANGTYITIPLEEMIHIKDLNPRKTGINYYNGASRLYAATRSINVLSNIYDTINTILSAKGALGFLSRESKAGEIDPLAWKDVVDEVERKINEDYGTTDGKKAIMTTVANMKWNRMDSPISEFMPVELNAQEFAQLCNQMGGMPDALLNSKGNSTYNNVLELKKAFLTNLLMPIHSNIFNTISIAFGINKLNEWIVADYSGEESLNNNTLENIKFMYESKLISKNQTLQLLGQPENSDQSFNNIENGTESSTTL